MLTTILVGLLVAVLIGLIGYLIAKIVPFLQPYQNEIGLGLFVIVALIYIISALR